MRKTALFCLSLLMASVLSWAQADLPLPYTLSPEQMMSYTGQYEGERFPDQRPKVSDRILERMRQVTCEEAWGVLRDHGYTNQYQGKWVMTHENPVLVGRAVTCNFIPHRPDVSDAVVAEARGQGLEGRDKHWIMDQLTTGDVMVADLMDRQIGGAFIGDNLANMIYKKTGTGLVIWGGARDLAGVLELKDFVVFNRNWDPSTSSTYDKTMVIGYNTPIAIGRAAVMPGDVVLGLREGVVFIPAHLALEVVETSEWTRLKDEFGHSRLQAGIYTAGQIDVEWTQEITDDFRGWVRSKINALPTEQQEMIKSQDWW
ncbi:MAG: RraA family protein [Saprospiraceae bacterium]|nr:RraA family protein [Saprospiraceae bacterium]